MAYFQPPTQIDSAEWTSGTDTNYDVRANQAATLFKNCPNPTHVIIRADQTITVRFNASTEPAITINANTAFELDLCVNNMFITTSGATPIKIVLTQ